MTFPSLFPTLPMLVMEKIIEYLVGRSRSSFDANMDRHNTKKGILVPLLSIDEFWREAVLVSICDNCAIGFNNKPGGFKVAFPAWPAAFSYPGFRKRSLVKWVVAAVPHWIDIVNGRYDEVVSRLLHKGALFPSAMTLLVCSTEIVQRVSGHPQPFRQTLVLTDVHIAHVISFARLPLKVTPAVTSVVVSVNHASTFKFGYIQLWTMLISELCQGSVNSLQVYSGRNERIVLGSMSISGLTGLIQQANMASAPFAMLAYRNAGTLRELRIRTGTQANWRTLIYGTSRTPTVYSRLTSFTLDIGNITSSTSWATISNAEPFPALSALEISEEYPFVDDFLLITQKGRRRFFSVAPLSLKSNVLGKFGILGRSGVRQMNTVDSAKTFSPTRVVGVIRQQIHRLLEMTTTLKLGKDTTDLQVYNAIRTAPGTATLQHLEFTAANLDAKQIIEIVSALSNLVSLTCRTLGIEADLMSIPEDELPGTIHATHYPLSSKFRRLRLSKPAKLPVSSMALAVMLIAIVCLNLSHTELQPYYRTAFCNAIKEAMTKTSFQLYTDPLHRLVK